MIKIIQALYKNDVNKIRIPNKECTESTTKVGLKQLCVLSPVLPSIVLDDTIEKYRGKSKVWKWDSGKWEL